MSLTILLERSSLQNHSMSQLSACVLYFGCAVQESRETRCRRKSKFLMKIKYIEIKYKTTSNLLYHHIMHAVQKVAPGELAKLQKLMQ